MSAYRLGRWVLILVASLAILSFVGCTGQPGPVMLAYSWVETPFYLYDSNPSTPSTVYNGVYFPTEPGSYYMEYQAWDASFWSISYSLEAHSGEMFLQNGAEADFEIALYAIGPSIYQWRGLSGTDVSDATGSAGPAPSVTQGARKTDQSTDATGFAVKSFSVEKGGYTLSVVVRRR